MLTSDTRERDHFSMRMWRILSFLFVSPSNIFKCFG